MVTVSIVIPSWNGRTLLAECLKSILRSPSSSYETEIIAVDDASEDDTVSYIKSTFPRVMLLENRSNQGYAKSVNRGVAASTGDLIFLLNNDTEFLEDPIDALTDFLMKHNAVGAVAPLLIHPDGRPQISCRRFPTPVAIMLEKIKIDRLGLLRKWKLTAEEHQKGGTVPQPMASALLIKRPCWQAVGPLDERFPIFFNDVDWCYRLYKNTHYRIALCTDAKVVHHVGATVNTLGLKKKQEFYKGLITFYLKHFPFRAEMGT